ncbi:hypothetical protein ABZ896_27950 [Streptomyces sp. NPDC047072]|uniref:hypothetical protein n=1 Tax=Streptomyces sp. NPDC047072 TaxID=3154809 RepID=UPI003404721D
MPNPGPAGSTDARTRLAAITLSPPAVPVPRQIGQDGAALPPAEDLARLEKAAAGASVVALEMADREARRALLADWVSRHAPEFPGGQLYFDMDEVRRDWAGDPSVMLAHFLRALGVVEEFIPPQFGDRFRALQQITQERRVLIVVDGAGSAAEAIVARCPPGLLLVSSRRRLDTLNAHGETVHLKVDSPPSTADDPGALVASLPRQARAVYRLLGHLPAPTVSPALLHHLVGASSQTAITQLTAAGLLVSASSPDRFRLRDSARAPAQDRARNESPDEQRRVRRQLTDAILTLVEEAAAICTRSDADDTARRAALEVLDAEQHTVTGIMQMINRDQWHREVWRLAMALCPLYDARVYESYWRDSHTLGVEAAMWDGAIDVQAELRTRLARLELLCGQWDHPERAGKEINRAQEMLSLVSNDRLRGLIWRTRAEVEEDQGRDPVPAWREALRFYTEAGDPVGAAASVARLGQALVAAGHAEEALSLLAGGASPSGADADLARAAAHRALGQHELALTTAVNAAQHAAEHAQYQLYASALTLLADTAADLQDEELLQMCRSKERQLAQVAGLTPVRPAD